MEIKELKKLIDTFVALPHETEWVEFKHNFHSPEEIGERISALSNSACIHKKAYGYIVFGIEDGTHKVIGTTFHAKSHKKGNEELELWLSSRLDPRIDFEAYEFDYEDHIHLSLYKIPAAINRPITFLHKAYVRVGSLTKPLGKHPDKEAKIWRNHNQKPLEAILVRKNVTAAEVISLLSVETYFDLMKIPTPQTSQGIIERFISEKLVVADEHGFSITELGAILFAKNLSDFSNLNRKSMRVIVYKGKNKIETVREQIGVKGYAVGFEGLIDWINGQLPANEEIGKALRKEVRMYPEIAIRELVANSIIHQDFSEQGFPMVEIYSDRIEISNPGLPLISSERFIDEYVSRNDSLADIMRRMGFCEEKGSGLDKTIFYNELYQLPAVNILLQEKRTIVCMYAYKTLNETDKNEKIRACYQHACLKYVSNEKMTNQSLRERFGIEPHNYSIASRIIRDALEEKVIKEDDPENKSRKYASYIPFWA
jgi:ATP-dependent DNA helicase RecG